MVGVDSMARSRSRQHAVARGRVGAHVPLVTGLQLLLFMTLLIVTLITVVNAENLDIAVDSDQPDSEFTLVDNSASTYGMYIVHVYAVYYL